MNINFMIKYKFSTLSKIYSRNYITIVPLGCIKFVVSFFFLPQICSYLQLILVLPSEDTQHPIMELHNLPWESTFQRFLNVAPTCSEDRELLLGIIQFFNFCTILWNERGIMLNYVCLLIT